MFKKLFLFILTLIIMSSTSHALVTLNIAEQIDMFIDGIVDNQGQELSFGTVFIYEADTGQSTTGEVWSDPTKNTSASNRIDLDKAGRASNTIFGDGQYDFVIQDRSGSIIRSLFNLEYRGASVNALLIAKNVTFDHTVFSPTDHIHVSTDITDLVTVDATIEDNGFSRGEIGKPSIYWAETPSVGIYIDGDGDMIFVVTDNIMMSMGRIVGGREIVISSNTNHIFRTSDNLFYLRFDGGGLVGIGGIPSDGRLHIRGKAGGVVPLLVLQAISNSSKELIKITATNVGIVSENVNTGSSKVGSFSIDINGTKRWIRYFDAEN